jgi:predicted outer membrane repeat protein
MTTMRQALVLALAVVSTALPTIDAETSSAQPLYCHTKILQSDLLYPAAEAICQNCTTIGACNAQAAAAVECTSESPPPGTVAVSTWAALRKGIAACKRGPLHGVNLGCSFELANGFTTPVEGFSNISVGDPVDPSSFSQNISINGKGTVIDAHGADRFFTVFLSSSLSITGVTMKNGKVPPEDACGAILFYGTGHLELVDCTFKKNSGGAFGGALYVQLTSGGTATIESCTFDLNEASYAGGAIWVSGGGEKGAAAMTLHSCTFKYNAVSKVVAGAILVQPQAFVAINSCSFNGNVGGQGGGGAVAVLPTGAVTFISSGFKGGDDDGGGTVTFACPPTSTGKAVSVTAEKEFLVAQLPPAEEIANCTPH